ncbi:NAD(P)H-quinone oxidoreductase [Arthrobacter sulfonylureivorans]|uniref:NAD(P)H-quinone oxidoreductase n=1 Tax=Arthrobacter sulfonylureivorans TaxID=2486855 RepID=A0ABY3WAT7_9MICC|nr:NAD(P)H-quinone oxidoreductase [Arthrobacter sulfonylureivorans]UNK45437.1 NAD(P)H-quinone oxidoreductase [Arthrobacter sulfonylureivorans]
MRAVFYEGAGGPEVLRLRETDAPQPAEGEVVIDVAAAGVNRADVQQRIGVYPPPPGASEIPGLEVSGRVSSVGAGVTAPRVGDEVCALLAGGGYAEQVAVPAGQVLPVPRGVDLVTAAALPEVAATVFSNLFMTAGVQAGETVLIHGGSGGIGTMAVQLVDAFGAVPAVTAGSQEKLDVARELGAEVLINYREEDFVERIKEATGGRGADVILDVVGAKYLQRNVDALATSGRLVVIGLQGGAKAELNLGQLMAKRGAVIGTTLRARPAEEKAAIMRAVAEHVWPLVVSGDVKPQVHRTFALADAAAAHEYFDSGAHTGKILLTTS